VESPAPRGHRAQVEEQLAGFDVIWTLACTNPSVFTSRDMIGMGDSDKLDPAL
jgi:hypothetical protein